MSTVETSDDCERPVRKDDGGNTGRLLHSGITHIDIIATVNKSAGAQPEWQRDE